MLGKYFSVRNDNSNNIYFYIASEITRCKYIAVDYHIKIWFAVYDIECEIQNLKDGSYKEVYPENVPEKLLEYINDPLFEIELEKYKRSLQ